MIKDSYLILDDNEIWTEKDCRKYLFDMEIGDYENNKELFEDKLCGYSFESKIQNLKGALYDNMKLVINHLGTWWNVPILDLTKYYHYEGFTIVFENFSEDKTAISFGVFTDDKLDKILIQSVLPIKDNSAFTFEDRIQKVVKDYKKFREGE